MLQFILGRPASGKTYTVLKRIKELAAQKKYSVLIVPEQFTFETEKAVLKILGEEATLFVKVISFTRLYDEIGRNIGGIAGTFLRDSDKIVFMNKTLNAVAGDLKLWGKYKSSVSFAKTLLDTIGEFKINSVSSDDLRKTAEITDSASLRDKLLDLSKIYDAYDLLMGERFIDPADTLTRVFEALKNYEYFKGKTVFIDSFKGFTGQQYKIIERIISQADDIYVSLTNDPDVCGEYCVYANIRKAILSIEYIAKSRAVKVSEPIVLKDSYYNSTALSTVERALAGKISEQENLGEDVVICKTNTVYDEASFVASEIRKLVRNENYRFRDFVIIARDSEKYGSAVEKACKINGVNLFYDKKIPLLAFPLSSAAIAALESINFSTEAILKFHKTGLGTLNNDEISILENYTFIWNIKGKMWQNQWYMDTRGLTAEPDKDGKAALELKLINSLRERAIAPIISFKENFGATAKHKSFALVKLFEECKVNIKLNEMCANYSHINYTYYADAIKSSYDEFMKILDSLVMCFGEASISHKEYFDALNLALSLDSVGVIPQTLDEVIFGDADRIRPSRPKVAFILGANQGEFPQSIGNKGIFALNERRKLVDSGINISDSAVQSAIDEEYLVYSSVCCPSDKLYVVYSEVSLTGEKKEASAFIEQIKKAVDCKILEYPSKLNIPETEHSAFAEYCRTLKSDQITALTLKNALFDTKFSNNVNAVGNGKVKTEDILSSDTAKKLYGNDIYMSATKFDTFNRCHFSFFCQYGLKAEKQKTADFNVLQRGTIVHYCLEKIISKYKKGIADLEYEFLDELCDRYIEEYLSLVEGFENVRDAKTEFIITRISRSLKEVVRNISDEMRQSDFEPTHCELKIGKDGEIPAVSFPFDSGNIILSGSIDRVDQYNGYVRIIDYKTGTKAFKLPDILFGLNMQMLIYLYCVIRCKGLSRLKPAGILYKTAKRDISDKGMAMNGLLPNDIGLLTAMEKENRGEFIPKIKINKDGSLAKKNESFISYEDFDVIFDYIEKIMKNTGETISSGDIAVNPVNGLKAEACKYCEYSKVCGIEDEEIFTVQNADSTSVIESIKEEAYATGTDA